MKRVGPPFYDETVTAVGMNIPTFEPIDSHEVFLQRHQFGTWMDETFTASRNVTAPARKPRKRAAKKP